MSRLAALLTAVLSSTALAQEARDAAVAQEVGPARQYTWSGGVGLRLAFFGPPSSSIVIGGLPGGGIGGIVTGGLSASAPVFLTEAGLERRVSETASLLLGLNLAYGTSFTEPQPPLQLPLDSGRPARNETTNATVGGTVGVRRWLTGPSSPVLLSVAATAGIGYARMWQHWLTSSQGVPVVSSGDAWSSTVGVGGSVAGERFLTDALSLRLSLQVLQASYSFGKARPPAILGMSASRTSGFSAGLSLSPALELRLYL